MRRPRVDLDARGDIEIHGTQTPVRGVWHTTECSDAAGIRELEGVVNFWERQRQGLGAHIIIDKDANSAYCARPSSITYAVAKRNTGSVHVELIGFARFVPRIWFLRRRQLHKLARWMAWLNLEYGIPIRFSVNHGWSGHRDQPHQTHTDPGRFFPKKYVLRLAAGYRAEGWR